MKKQLIQLSKDKGFESKFLYDFPYVYTPNEDLRYALWMSELQKWIRDNYDIHINPTPYLESTVPEDTEVTGYYVGDIYDSQGKELCWIIDWNYGTQEEALETGLFHVIKLIQCLKYIKESEKQLMPPKNHIPRAVYTGI